MGNCISGEVDDLQVRRRLEISAPTLIEAPTYKNVILPRELMYAIHYSPDYQHFFKGPWWQRLRADVRTQDVLDDNATLARLITILAENPRRIHNDEDEDGLVKAVFEVLGTIVDDDGNVTEAPEVRHTLDIMFPKPTIEEDASIYSAPRTLVNSKGTSITKGNSATGTLQPEKDTSKELEKYLSFLKRTGRKPKSKKGDDDGLEQEKVLLDHAQ